jgi:protein O-GlcNAc transferase
VFVALLQVPQGGLALSDNFDVLRHAAIAARQSGDLALATALYDKALALRPDDVDCLCDFARTLSAAGQGERAAHMLNAGLRARPGELKIMVALGQTLRATNRFDLAVNLWLLCVQTMPHLALAHYELGQALLGRAEPERAADAFAKAASLSDGAERDLALKAELLALAYSGTADPAAVLALNATRAQALAPAPTHAVAPHENAREPERRLRIGYVSSDFRYHSVARPLEALFAYRDRRRFEVFAYAELRADDAITQRFKALADHWVATREMSDADIAARIRADGIDILVLSAGHFDENRLGVALHRPAPVQISIYDSGTLGSDALDAIVLDPGMAGGSDDRWIERPLRTRHMFGHPPLDIAPPVLEPPVRANGFVTFGTANHPSKFSKQTFALWARALAAVPGSQLRLKSGQRYDDPDTVANFVQRFAAYGIGAERLVFERGNPNLVDHLRFYQRIDLALDTTPFNGATTTFEALWMGVPVLALRGTTVMARWSAAELARIGADDWTAADADSYAALAVRMAAQAPHQDRAALRARVAASALCDLPGHARAYERLYRALWRRWCAKTT